MIKLKRPEPETVDSIIATVLYGIFLICMIVWFVVIRVN
jgi:hypothetical protein